MYNQEFDIYISFATEDTAKVQRIVEELEWSGIKCWYRHQPEASADSIALLTQQLAGKAHVVIWSNDSAASGRIQAEARATSAQKRLVAVRIDAVLPPKGTKAEAYADLTDWAGGTDHRGMKKLLYAIHALTGKGPAPDPSEVQNLNQAAVQTEVDMLTDPEKDERAWQITLSFNNKTYLEHYLNHFPQGAHVAEARERLEKKKRTGRIIMTCAIIYFIAQIIFSVIINLASL